MKKFKRILIWTLVSVLFVGTFVFLYLNSQEKEAEYATLRPSIQTIERSTVLTGKIEPRDEIEIKPQISGIISEISVEPGDLVREGDVIARIKVIPDASSLSSAQSRIATAEIDLADATSRYERDKALFEKKVLSREEFETSLKNYKRAQEELSAARDALSIVRQGVSKFNAKESNTLVRATITGLVLDVPVKVGSSVIQANTMNSGTTIATLADMNNLIFRGKVDETEVGSVAIGTPMDISIGAAPDLKPTAVVDYIAPKSDNSSGANSFELKAGIKVDDASKIRAGYSANASIILQRAADVLTVPESAVSFEGEKTYVYVRTDSVPKAVFERREIKTGLSDGINIEVKSGIDGKAVLRGEIINGK